MTAAAAFMRAAAPGFAAGLLMAAGQAPVSLAIVGFLGLCVLLALLDRAADARGAALAGWSGGAGYFAGSMFWIVEPFLIDPLVYGWMAPFALVLLPSGLALFWGAAFWGAARLGAGALRLALGAVLLAAAEASRAFVLTGFPWGLIGYVWIDTPLMQAASVIGPHGLTLLTVLAAALVAAGVGRPRVWLASPAFAVLMLAGAWLWGQARLAAPQPPAPGVTVRIVQPNAEQGLKWDPGLAEEFLARLFAATSTPAGATPPDLTVWPETAVPYLLNGSEPLLAAIDAAAQGRPVAFGIVRKEDPRLYNSLVVTGPGGSVAQVYDKRHLTPFGEYMPLGEVFAALGIHGLAASHGGGFSAGTEPVLLDLGTAGRALPLICYEAIFPQHVMSDERPDWLLQITNDAWFGRISGPYQHFAQARMRAVEQGLPLIRAANTGVSGLIDAKGRVVGQIPLGRQAFLDVALPAPLPATPYSRRGDVPAFAAMAVLVGMLVALRLVARTRDSH